MWASLHAQRSLDKAHPPPYDHEEDPQLADGGWQTQQNRHSRETEKQQCSEHAHPRAIVCLSGLVWGNTFSTNFLKIRKSSDGYNRSDNGFFPSVCACFSLGPPLITLCEISIVSFLVRSLSVFFQYLGKCNHQHFRKAELFGNDFGNRLKKSLVMLAVNILMDSKTGWFLIFILVFSIPNIFCIYSFWSWYADKLLDLH